MNLRIDPGLFFKLSLSFVLFTFIGTLSHELGHFLAAEIRGFDAVLHFDHVNWGGKAADRIDNFWITFAGPLQTMGTGSLAFFFLLRKRLKEKSNQLNFSSWVLLFLSLFWLRQPFNLMVSIFLKINGDKTSFFGGDEAYLSSELGLYDGFISFSTAIIGLLIVGFIFLRVVPKKDQFTFLLSAIIGSTLGYYVWNQQLGPIFLS